MAQMTEMARGLVTLADVNSCFRPSPTDAISRQKHRPGIHRSRKAVFINRLAPVQCHNREELHWIARAENRELVSKAGAKSLHVSK